MRNPFLPRLSLQNLLLSSAENKSGSLFGISDLVLRPSVREYPSSIPKLKPLLYRFSRNSRELTVPKAVLLVNPAHIELQSEPIPTQWILSGAPEARGTKLTTSNDGTSSVVVWECTPGSFKWDYSARMKPR